MGPRVRVGIVGEYRAEFPPHPATDAGLAHAAAALGLACETRWVSTGSVGPDPAAALAPYDALLVAPGSPYRSLDGALAAIRHARERGVPTLGTCGGLQHIVLEYARHVLGFADAQHAEYDPYASRLFLVPLSCSLVGRAMRVGLDPASRAARCYGGVTAEEQYYCNFGLNPEYRDALHDGGLRVVGWDAELGEARVFEIPGHPFFLGTLYVPQLRSTPERPHPLLRAFLESAAGRAAATVAPRSDVSRR
jgi:CTP synthase (UTP-ammonia lyase)